MINFKEQFILENERVLLTPLVLDNINDLLPFSLNEPDLWMYSLVPGSGKENLSNYIKTAVKDRDQNISYPFLVFDKKLNNVAGTTRFYDYQPTHNTIQLGYTWYGKEFHGTGLNKNCKYLMLQLAFDQWDLERVEFRADNNNKRSINAMKSIGCVQEGILRSNCASVNGRRDSIILSILKNEWISSVKEHLKTKVELINNVS